jgi:hypothetical protein
MNFIVEDGDLILILLNFVIFTFTKLQNCNFMKNINQIK